MGKWIDRDHYRVVADATGRDDKAQPYIDFVGGPRPYIWIGDDESGCYATVEPKALASLAQKVVDAEQKRATP